tara:strand:- start:2928 stop:3860 length:933 start_codon:yes stop_codon:yes gene_type:complete
MRILHLNNPAQVASNLVKAQRELGIDANLAITGNKRLHDNYDYDLSSISTKYFRGKFDLGRRLYDLIKDCDILHYHGQAISTGYRDLIMWAGIMKKPIILHYHGSEIRNKKSSQFVNDFVEHIYVSTPDLLKSVKSAEWLPNPVNLEKRVYSDLAITEKLIVLHAPSNRKIKNTQAVIDSIDILKDEGIEIELNLAENIGHEKLMEMISESHLIIDWVNPDFGIYGVLSIESMAMGRPVICTLTESLYKKYDLPIIHCHPNDLSSKIRNLSSTRDKLIDKGKLGYDFVHKYHDSTEIAKKVINRYESILG